jgi:histidine triad (HIT) family protein
MPTVFSRIVAGELPCHRIAEDERFLAFLDVMPLVEGHVLVIPKAEVDQFFDLDPEVLAGLTVFAAGVARAIRQAIPCKRVGAAVIGLEVPHAHLHLVPLQTVGDINFERPKLKPTADELSAVAARIVAAYHVGAAD